MSEQLPYFDEDFSRRILPDSICHTEGVIAFIRSRKDFFGFVHELANQEMIDSGWLRQLWEEDTCLFAPHPQKVVLRKPASESIYDMTASNPFTAPYLLARQNNDIIADDRITPFEINGIYYFITDNYLKENPGKIITPSGRRRIMVGGIRVLARDYLEALRSFLEIKNAQ